MARVRLSVITPVFNCARFIEFCLENVMRQECPEVEHVIVDGGSTDGTVAIIERYAALHDHIRYVSERDEGQSHAMNKGIAMARGEIVGFLNADDYYEPGALREVLTQWDGLPEPSLLVGNCNVWDDDGKLWFVSRPAGISLNNLLLGRYVEAFPMNPAAYFYHKSLHLRVGPYRVEEHAAMDLHFIFRAVQHAHVTYRDRTWGNYRYLEGTKTYEGDKCGANQARVRQITEQYRRQQPALRRIQLVLLEKFGRLFRKPAGVPEIH
ncbi:glycosyltransferase [Geomonas oryzisoli]|uniref:Glycosyltransferase n=1 Tax=Geomonas oryzisoli TaxID=2847992 RepID=A0ABX8J9G6_9BACT|nr:glycosyltransferase family 2 protein [Geomonas oryzisoli]QWV95074.1 glycosyltransferase [Geomonas oryzisoli]